MRVCELEKIGIIREVHLSKKKNCHTECKISIYMDTDDEISQLSKLIGKEVCVEDDQRIYLRGVISNVDCDITYSGSYACVLISSLSKKVDGEKKYRIFQDTKKKYKDVIAFFSEGGNNIQITDNELANSIVEEILVQEGMSDFDFIRKTANNVGYDLYIIDTEVSPSINICRATDYSKASLNEKNTKTYKFEKDEYTEKLTIKSTDFLEIGQVTEYQGVQYTVVSVDILYVDGENRFTYVLEKKNTPMCSTFYSGNLGEAEVTSNKDPEKKGRIQVKFLNYEDKMEENRIWVSYMNNITEKKQGSMLIPGVEEIINVSCRNGKCYSSGCIRMESYDEKMCNPDERIIMFKDKSIVINDDSIILEAFGNEVTISDDLMSVCKDDSQVRIEKESIFIQMGESKCRMDNGSVQIQTSDNVDIKSSKMNIDVSGKMGIKAATFDVG